MTLSFAPVLLSALWWTDANSLWHQHTFFRLLIALGLGICVGAERQWRQRTAGLRTNTLVCLGAATFVDLGSTVAPGSTQVIAYVVSGVGFLGAGAIMKEGLNIRGLNTAATLWCSAAVGACVGAGQVLDGVFVSVLLIAINSVLRPLSRFIDRRSLAAMSPHVLYQLKVVCGVEHEEEAKKRMTSAVEGESLRLRTLRASTDEETETAILLAVLESPSRSNKGLEKIATQLRAYPWVESVEVTTTDVESE